MSAERNLISVLEKLLALQKSLHEVAVRKTKILKDGDIESLGKHMKDEIKHIKAIEVLNNERENLQRQFAKDLPINISNVTISHLLEYGKFIEAERLKVLQNELIQTVNHLKQVNDFNQSLLNQSLQFVNLNLDLLTGRQESPNYSKDPIDHTEEMNSRSLFDSKA
ncbi:flagellar protein FlgN [Bacillus sp. AK031]